MARELTRRPIATIDVGTNTTLLLVARPKAGPGTGPGDPEVLADAAQITRLGRGIGGDGRLRPEGIERTLAALDQYARIAAQHDAEIAAIGTEALRRAPNADEFLEPARKILGYPVEVIAGDREADLTFRAIVESFPGEVARGLVAIADIGGGSTEIIVADHGTVLFRRSLPLGSVRLHERHVLNDPPTHAETHAIESDISATLDAAGDAFKRTPFAAVFGVAGTVTSLGAMTLKLDSYDSALVHGQQLTMSDIDAQIARLGSATQAQRERIAGLDPGRADVIFAGALLLRAIARRAGVGAVRVSDRGIRWGLYHERVSARERPSGNDLPRATS
jgi:exopolyphosphatase / guanosine-5'-triphosphate,3'-diphosphate pyrophosphatase